MPRPCSTSLTNSSARKHLRPRPFSRRWRTIREKFSRSKRNRKLWAVSGHTRRSAGCANRRKSLINQGWRRKGPDVPTGLQDRRACKSPSWSPSLSRHKLSQSQKMVSFVNCRIPRAELRTQCVGPPENASIAELGDSQRPPSRRARKIRYNPRGAA
jgi:hypothetical protein